MDPPSGQLQTAGLQRLDADPPFDETAPSIGDVKEAVAKLRGGKAAGICNISVELLKAGGDAMIHGLHAVVTAVWHSDTIPPDWKKGVGCPNLEGERGPSRLQQLLWNNTAQHTRQGACPFAADADPHLPAEASET